MSSAMIIKPFQQRFLTEFLRDYTPEGLPVSGPFINLFKNLEPSQPTNKVNPTICPKIPDFIGSPTASKLITNEANYFYQLYIAIISMLLEFISQVALPEANAWVQVERNALLSAGLHYLVETNPDINTAFDRSRLRHKLPAPAGVDNTTTLGKYL